MDDSFDIVKDTSMFNQIPDSHCVREKRLWFAEKSKYHKEN